METTRKTFWKGIKEEFHKIIWEKPKTVAKQVVVVVATTIVIGVVISLIDLGIQALIRLIA